MPYITCSTSHPNQTESCMTFIITGGSWISKHNVKLYNAIAQWCTGYNFYSVLFKGTSYHTKII